MKITIEENKPKRTYPYLGRQSGTENVFIIAFTAPGTGVVVSGDSFHRAGLFRDTWEESIFTPMHTQPEPEPEPIQVKDRKYPYVGKSKNEMVVLFLEEKRGITLEKGTQKHEKELYHSSVWKEDAFTPIPVTRIIIDLE